MTQTSRTGMSVVEVLVALVIVAVGLLGIAGSSALALRSSLAAAREHRAQQQAVTRLAQLTAAGCGLARSGAAIDTLHQMHEQWTVGAASGGVVIATDSVSWPNEHGLRALHLATAIPC